MEEGRYQLNRFEGSQIDWTKAYSLIGAFVVEFEQITDHIRHHCSIILQIRGLADWHLSETIFHSRLYTTDPLFIAYRSMVSYLLKDREDIMKLFAELGKRMQKAVETRNLLLHGTYHMGDNIVEVTDKDAPSEFAFVKKVPKVTGKIEARVIQSFQEIEGMIKEMKTLRNDIWEFTGKVMMGINEITPVEISRMKATTGE